MDAMETVREPPLNETCVIMQEGIYVQCAPVLSNARHVLYILLVCLYIAVYFPCS